MSKHLLVVGSAISHCALTKSFSRAFKSQWEISAIGNAAQALDLVESSNFNAVITELDLPDRSGPQLLNEILCRKPEVHRFLLVDLTDRQSLRKCVGTAHQLLSKNCSAADLESALARSVKLDTWFGNPEIDAVVTRMGKVPSPPATYFQIAQELQSVAVSMENIGRLISQDPEVAAKLLQMVNSAAFGLRRPMTNPGDVVTHLGAETTKSLILLAHAYAHFDRIPSHVFSVEALWRHSLGVGRLARAVARFEGADGDTVDQSFTAGLLHDMGKLVLAANHPETYQTIGRSHEIGTGPLWRREQHAFGATHAEVGAWLAAVWGLPLEIIEAIALHHRPNRVLPSEFSPLSAVHIADALEHQAAADLAQKIPAMIDEVYLASLGLSDRLESWRDLADTILPQAASDDWTTERLAA